MGRRTSAADAALGDGRLPGGLAEEGGCGWCPVEVPGLDGVRAEVCRKSEGEIVQSKAPASGRPAVGGLEGVPRDEAGLMAASSSDGRIV